MGAILSPQRGRAEGKGESLAQKKGRTGSYALRSGRIQTPVGTEHIIEFHAGSDRGSNTAERGCGGKAAVSGMQLCRKANKRSRGRRETSAGFAGAGGRAAGGGGRAGGGRGPDAAKEPWRVIGSR